MGIRITSHAVGPGLAVSVLGTLDGAACRLLTEEVRGASVESLVLDVAGLVGLDEAGASLLRALRAGGASIEHASPYIALRLAPDMGSERHRAP